MHLVEEFMRFLFGFVFVAGSPIFREHIPTLVFGDGIGGSFTNMIEFFNNVVVGTAGAECQRNSFRQAEQRFTETTWNHPPPKMRECAIDIESNGFVFFLQGASECFLLSGGMEFHRFGV